MTATASQSTALTDMEESFLESWKAGVHHAGEKLFGCQARTPADAEHWHQLTPDLITIRKALPNRSRAEAAFIAALASFFNAEEGQKLFSKAGCTFGDLATVLRPNQRAILANLIVSFRGW